MKQFSLLLFLIVWIISAKAGQMYQCTDEEGNTQYTQVPSAGCQEVKSLPKQLISSQSAETTAKSEESDQNSEPAAESAAAPQPSPSREKNCEVARKNLTMLNSDAQVRKPKSDNPEEFVVLTGEMRQQEIAGLEAYLEKNCQEEK